MWTVWEIIRAEANLKIDKSFAFGHSVYNVVSKYLRGITFLNFEENTDTLLIRNCRRKIEKCFYYNLPYDCEMSFAYCKTT